MNFVFSFCVSTENETENENEIRSDSNRTSCYDYRPTYSAPITSARGQTVSMTSASTVLAAGCRRASGGEIFELPESGSLRRPGDDCRHLVRRPAGSVWLVVSCLVAARYNRLHDLCRLIDLIDLTPGAGLTRLCRRQCCTTSAPWPRRLLSCVMM